MATAKNTTKTSTMKKVTASATTSSAKSSISNPYKSNGISVNPTKFTCGDKVKVTYTGLLSQCGANEIYAHIGWGENWENVNDIKMSKTKTGFTATITAHNSDMNLCFKDTCDNWDNNNGNNYTVSCK